MAAYFLSPQNAQQPVTATATVMFMDDHNLHDQHLQQNHHQHHYIQQHHQIQHESLHAETQNSAEANDYYPSSATIYEDHHQHHPQLIQSYDQPYELYGAQYHGHMGASSGSQPMRIDVTTTYVQQASQQQNHHLGNQIYQDPSHAFPPQGASMTITPCSSVGLPLTSDSWRPSGYDSRITARHHNQQFHTDQPVSNFDWQIRHEDGQEEDAAQLPPLIQDPKEDEEQEEAPCRPTARRPVKYKSRRSTGRSKAHSKLQKNNNNNSTNTDTSMTTKFQCFLCAKQYCRRSTLKAHLRQHSGERPFFCTICGKSFSQAANLTAHKRIHTGEKPFACPICYRPFSQSSSLVTHKRTHTGERPYQCQRCDKAFTDSSTLTKHVRTHTGHKPYQCRICLLSFSQSGNLNRHMKTHMKQMPIGQQLQEDHDPLLPPPPLTLGGYVFQQSPAAQQPII